MKAFFVALLALLLPASAPAERPAPWSFPQDSVVMLSCGNAGWGTATRVAPDLYVTAAHVTDVGNCRVDGTPITDVVSDSVTDTATFRGPAGTAVMPYSCRHRYRPGAVYLSVGYVERIPLVRLELPHISAGTTSDGFARFVGEMIPGMSGGPSISETGELAGVNSMRWPARTRPISDTPLCRNRSR